MKGLIMTVCLAASALFAQAQQDTRPVVGVAEFTCDAESPYAKIDFAAQLWYNINHRTYFL